MKVNSLKNFWTNFLNPEKIIDREETEVIDIQKTLVLLDSLVELRILRSKDFKNLMCANNFIFPMLITGNHI